MLAVSKSHDIHMSHKLHFQYCIFCIAPQLSKFESISLSNHSIRIEWVLGTNGGSDNIQMSIELRTREIKKRRDVESVPMTFDVEVTQNTLISPVLPFGRSYEIIGTLINEYGTNIYTITSKSNNS